MKKFFFKFWWLLILLIGIVIGVIVLTNKDDIDTKKMLGTYSNGEARITLKEKGKCAVEVYDYNAQIKCEWKVMGYYDGKKIGEDDAKYPWAKIIMDDGSKVELDALFLLNYSEFMDPNNQVKWEKQGDDAGEANSGKLNSALSKTYEPTYDTSYSAEPDIPESGKSLEAAKMEAKVYVKAYKDEVISRGYDYNEFLKQQGYNSESEFFDAIVEKYMKES